MCYSCVIDQLPAPASDVRFRRLFPRPRKKYGREAPRQRACRKLFQRLKLEQIKEKIGGSREEDSHNSFD